VPVPEDDFSIKENDLKLHLTSELEKLSDTNASTAETEEEKDKEQKSVITQKEILDDIQLKTAIDIAKVLKIQSK